MQDEIIQKIKQWMSQDLSDHEIAQRFGVTDSIVWRCRCRNGLFRKNECPHCGNRDYIPEKPCPNRRCITVWPLAFLKGMKK